MLEYIYSDFQKSEILKNLGIKHVFEEDFNKIRNMSGEEFVSEILVKKLNAKYVICGRDFKFRLQRRNRDFQVVPYSNRTYSQRLAFASGKHSKRS